MMTVVTVVMMWLIARPFFHVIVLRTDWYYPRRLVRRLHPLLIDENPGVPPGCLDVDHTALRRRKLLAVAGLWLNGLLGLKPWRM